MSQYFVYILASKIDGSLYTGQTIDLKDRLHRHNNGLVRVTKAKAPYELGYFERYQSRAEAMWREWELKKRYNTERKKRLVQSFDKSAINKILGL